MADQPITVMAKLGQIDTLKLDATVREQHTGSNTVTDHPVEQGANISDHSRPDPDRLVLDCIVSNTPLSDGSTHTVESNGYNFTVTAAQDSTRAPNAYQKLQDLRLNGTLVSVVTTLRTYSSMLIESITIPVDAKTAGAIRFQVNLKQVRVVQNSLTAVTVSKDTRRGPTAKTGAQTMTFTEEDVYGKQSPLNALVEGGRSALSNGVLGGYVGAVGN